MIVLSLLTTSVTLLFPLLTAQALPSAEDLFGSLQPASHVSCDTCDTSPLSLGAMQVNWGLSVCEREKASGKERARARALFGSHCNTLQHTATHCNTLQHTTTHAPCLAHSSQPRTPHTRSANEPLMIGLFLQKSH